MNEHINKENTNNIIADLLSIKTREYNFFPAMSKLRSIFCFFVYKWNYLKFVNYRIYNN